MRNGVVLLAKQPLDCFLVMSQQQSVINGLVTIIESATKHRAKTSIHEFFCRKNGIVSDNEVSSVVVFRLACLSPIFQSLEKSAKTNRLFGVLTTN